MEFALEGFQSDHSVVLLVLNLVHDAEGAFAENFEDFEAVGKDVPDGVRHAGVVFGFGRLRGLG